MIHTSTISNLRASTEFLIRVTILAIMQYPVTFTDLQKIPIHLVLGHFLGHGHGHCRTPTPDLEITPQIGHLEPCVNSRKYSASPRNCEWILFGTVMLYKNFIFLSQLEIFDKKTLPFANSHQWPGNITNLRQNAYGTVGRESRFL